MSEIVEFVVMAKDMMSSVFPKVASTAHSAFNKIKADIEQMEKPIKLSLDTTQLMKSGSMLGDVIGGTLIARGISKGLAVGTKLIGNSINAGMENAMRQKSFEVLTGNAFIGRNLVAQLRDLKQSTIMGLSVYKNAQTLMGFGLSRLETLRVLRQVGDIAMGDQERMQSLTLAFAQVSAAGKLAGQDLLQFINAGFNPLQIMAERWKQFGFTTVQTVGTLKQQMEKGAISSQMVAKAFELATGEGGKFYHMMDQIGETTGGKLMKMKGAFAAFEIDMGNRLKPLTELFIDSATGILHWTENANAAVDDLLLERAEVNGMVDAISRLNKGNSTRGDLIDMLLKKYPDLFGNIDKETIANKDLLSMLDRVNSAYKNRIAFASNKLLADDIRKQAEELQALATRARAQASLKEQQGLGMWDTRNFRILSAYDRIRMEKSGIPYDETPNGLRQFAVMAESMVSKLIKQQGTSDSQVKRDELLQLIDNATAMAWAKSTPIKLQGELRSELANWSKAAFGKNESGLLGYDYSKLRKLMGVDDKNTNADISKALSGATSGITTGGQKQVHINFRNVVENMYNNVEGGKTVVEKIEPELEEMIDRVFAKVI